MLKQLDIGIGEIQILLDKETQIGRGKDTLNLSPYFIILQTVINQNPKKIQAFSPENGEYSIPIPSEIDTKELFVDESKINRF